MERGGMAVMFNLGDAEHELRLPESSQIVLASPGVRTAKHGVVFLPQDTVVVIESGATRAVADNAVEL
jgi:hypothetical protein